MEPISDEKEMCNTKSNANLLVNLTDPQGQTVFASKLQFMSFLPP